MGPESAYRGTIPKDSLNLFGGAQLHFGWDIDVSHGSWLIEMLALIFEGELRKDSLSQGSWSSNGIHKSQLHPHPQEKAHSPLGFQLTFQNQLNITSLWIFTGNEVIYWHKHFSLHLLHPFICYDKQVSLLPPFFVHVLIINIISFFQQQMSS